MLNSYKTLINGIATAVNALKAEVKKLSGKVESIDLPEIDGQTIIKGADGKLKTAIGGHDYEFDIYHGDGSGVDSIISVDDGDVEGLGYFRYSAFTPSAEQLKGAKIGVVDNINAFAISNVTKAGSVAAKVFCSHPSLSGIVAAYVIYADDVSLDGFAFPKKGTYFLFFFNRLWKGTFEKVNEKFLPPMPMTVNVTGAGTDDDPYIADRTSDEIYEAVKAGMSVVAHLPEDDGRDYLEYQLIDADRRGFAYFFGIDSSGDNSRAYALPLRQLRIRDDGKASVYNWYLHHDNQKEMRQSAGNGYYYALRLGEYATAEIIDERYNKTAKVITSNYVKSDIGNIYSENEVPSVQAVYNRFESLKTNFVLNSSTSGSSKQFKITVDDSGTISATEVTS